MFLKEKPILDVNLEQQIVLQELIFPLNINMIVAFSLNQKKLEIGKVVSFDNSNVIIHLFKNILQSKLIIWTVSEPQ